MITRQKYIVVRLRGKNEIFTFPLSVHHDRMVLAVEAICFSTSNSHGGKIGECEVLGAGFITNGVCHGRSETLDIDSRGELDTALLNGMAA